VQAEIDAEIPVPDVVAERIIPTDTPHLEPVPSFPDRALAIASAAVSMPST
jgi:hypothetical protein